MTLPSEIMLAPLGALYGAVTRARLALYRKGVLPVYEIGAPVISVGNITTGGTGKTPLVEWLARTAAGWGQRVCILTRGYGRPSQNRRVLVSDGERILAEAREGGDEPRMLAEMLQGLAAVISDVDRVSAGRWAMEHLGSDFFILDDGFQHLRIARNINIVTVDATSPWGGGRLLPRGRLREPLQGLARADCIIITRADQVRQIGPLREQAARLSHDRPVILAHSRTRGLRPLFTTPNQDLNAGPVKQPVAAFCAIGNPRTFFAHICKDGYTLSYTQAFPDHHVYTQSELDALTRAAREREAQLLLTTAKDAVKLRSLHFELPCYVLEIEIGFDDEDQILSMIREATRD
ncbi:MAG TPA: tetraacyldisaccharide 4'-kinase [Pyrinomonadaceae bacterium]|nr:tetraacyldisaccharide 4'-kinase [Pyrinomonadaceae bacterium]